MQKKKSNFITRRYKYFNTEVQKIFEIMYAVCALHQEASLLLSLKKYFNKKKKKNV